jgi:chromosome segregation ATPase
LKDFERKLIDSQQEAGRTKEERLAMNARVKVLRLEKAEIVTKLETAENVLKEVETRYEAKLIASQRETSKAKEKAMSMHDKLKILQSEKAHFESKLRNAEKSFEDVENKLSDLQQETSKAKERGVVSDEKVKLLQTEKADIETKLKDAEKSKKEVGEKISSSRREAIKAEKQKMVKDEKVKVLESEKADIQTKLRETEKSLKEVEKRFEANLSASQLHTNQCTDSGLETEKGCTGCIVAKESGRLRWTRSFRTAFAKAKVLAQGGMAEIKVRGAQVMEGAFHKVLAIVTSERGKLVSEEGVWLSVLI